MKLANFSSMILASIGLLVLLGCKPKNSLEQFIATTKSKSTIHVIYSTAYGDETKDVEFYVQYKGDHQPVRARAVSAPFKLVSNEFDGSLEIDDEEREYMQIPYFGKFYMGTTKVFPEAFIQPNPLLGMSPFDFAPQDKWKLSTGTGIDTWTTTISTQTGPIEIALNLTKSGEPKSFVTGESTLTVKKFEMLDDQPMSNYQLDVPDGYLPFTKPMELMELAVGRKWSDDQLKRVGKYTSFNRTGPTLYALLDPAEKPSAKAEEWILTADSAYAKVPVYFGVEKEGLCDVKKEFLYNWSSGLPAFALVSKDGIVMGLWIGFDEPTMKKEITDLLKNGD